MGRSVGAPNSTRATSAYSITGLFHGGATVASGDAICDHSTELEGASHLTFGRERQVPAAQIRSSR